MNDTESMQSFPDILVRNTMVKAIELGLEFDDVERVKRSLREIISFRYDDACEMAVKNLLKDIGVGFDREIRYRLERDFFHSVTGYIIRRLQVSRQIRRTGLPGRRRIPRVFYRLAETEYSELVELMEEKVKLSKFLSYESSRAGYFAESLWFSAFQDLGFEILGRETSRFMGKRATIGGDIDFIARRDGLTYGVEIKNSLSYPDDLSQKFRISLELGVIPFFVARWISKSQFHMVRRYGGLVKLYETSIYPTRYAEIIERCRRVLGFPLIALEKISGGPKRHLMKIHGIAAIEADSIRLANKRFWREYPFF